MAATEVNDQHDLDEPDDLDVPAPSEPTGGGSLLDQLVAERDRIADDQTVDLEVPNNAGILWATYRLLPWNVFKGYAEAAARSKAKKRELIYAAAMIAEACVDVWLRNPQTGEREPWPGGEEGVRYDARLLAFLRLDALPASAKPSDYVRVVFAPPPKSGGIARETAVNSHHLELVRWMEGASAAVNREFAEG